MADFSNAVQTAIFNRLTSGLTPIAVYDAPPHQLDGQPYTQFPFVTMGDDTLTPFDTDTSLGAEVTCTIHIWSRYKGRKETKTIMASIYNLLHRQASALSASGVRFVDCLWEFGEVIEEIDGATRHGVCRYRLVLEAS